MRSQSTDAEWKLWEIVRGRRLGGYEFRRPGSQHQERVAYDAARTATLEALGWFVLRFDNYDVLTNAVGVGDTILLELQAVRT